jgi:2-amino-4-hydroxy-6-hydroxymethyldihydropteridine diphosphokinase
MNFEAWEPLYLDILEDFGFSRKGDEEAAEELSVLISSLCPEETKSIRDGIESMVVGRRAVVCGNAPSLASELEGLLSGLDLSSDKRSFAFIAADGATSTLLKAGVVPDVIVTDLDGDVEEIIRSRSLGSLVVVHAHGDNIDKLKSYVPRLGCVIGTTQSRPVRLVENFGGFTDGDRCVFLAKSLGASKITLIGFDYDDPGVTPRKAKKLMWARKLVDMAMSDCR